MSRFFGRIKERISNANSDDKWFWGLTIGSGVLAFVAGLFDKKIKDRLYSEKLDKEISEKAKKMLEEKETTTES